jgi:hypothetical protein
MDPKVQQSPELLRGKELYESLSNDDKAQVDRILTAFGLSVDNLSLEVGTQVYRELAKENGQLGLFGETDD